MRKVGYVEIDRHSTAARCSKCGKTLAYRLPMNLSMWQEVLKAFIRRHKICGETP